MLVPLRKAVELTGLHPNTLRKYADSGKIKAVKNPRGQRYFDVSSLFTDDTSNTKPFVVCYCRVSSSKQQDDLARQVVYMREQFPHAEIIKDIGSGLNFKRKGFTSILDRLMLGDKLTLIVSHRDRLCRFGFELIEYLTVKNGGEILVLNKVEHSPEQELTCDLLSILHVFSCRMHGLRRYSSQIKEDKDLLKL